MIQFQVYMLNQTLVIIQMLIDSLSYIAIIINNHRISISLQIQTKQNQRPLE